MSTYSIINLRQFNWIKLRRSWGQSFANYFIWLKDEKIRLPMKIEGESSRPFSTFEYLVLWSLFRFHLHNFKRHAFSWHTWRCKCVNKESRTKSALRALSVEICILIKDCDLKMKSTWDSCACRSLCHNFRRFCHKFQGFCVFALQVDNDEPVS